MASGMVLRHTLTARNLSQASENRIHDDATARRFGFQGGLVAGAEVYAWMGSYALGTWGLDWLHHGRAECRLLKPVYDGAPVLMTITALGSGALALEVESGGLRCAEGRIREAPPQAAPPVSSIPDGALPEPDRRPDAAAELLLPGTVLGSFETVVTAAEQAEYLEGVSEEHPLCAREALVHPGQILRLANRALANTVRLGPWMHVASTVAHHSPARIGEALVTRAQVTAEYERRGHRFVDLDVLVASGRRAVARIAHTAIWRPRQVADAA